MGDVGSVHAADQTLSVSTATGTELVVGQPIRITVAAKSGSLISGKIVVSGDSSPPMEYPIEVPAGSTKELTVVGMPLQMPREGYSIAWLDADGKRVANANLRSALDPGDTVVGVFPSLGTDFPETITQPTETDSHLFTIPDGQLDLPSIAFPQYDVIIGTMDDIERLDDDLRSSLMQWLASGGRLVLDDGDEAAVAEIVGELESGSRYGDGEVMLTSGTVRGDGWKAATLPIQARSIASIGPIQWIGGGGFGAEAPTQSLVKYSGDPMIGAGWLLLLVVLYAVIIGPMMFIALRRNRRAAWVVGPLIAIIACGLIWLDSARRRDSIKNAHGTVIIVDEVASEARSTEMLYVRSKAPTRLTLPPDFTLATSYDYAPQEIALGNDGTTISKTADVGSFVVYDGSGPAPEFDAQITGTATADGDDVSGEVTNHLDVDLHQVGVLWNGKAKNIGDVPAGETVKFELDKTNRVAEMAAFNVWGDAFKRFGDFGFGGPKPSKQPRPDIVSPAVLDSLMFSDPTIGTSGDVDIVGWTDELDSPITGSPNGVSVVSAKLPPESAETDGRSALVYATESNSAIGWSATSLVRLDAPESAKDSVLTLTKLWTSAELLVNGQWVEVQPDSSRSITIPADVLDGDGGIYLKGELNLERASGGFDLPRLHTPAAEEKVVSLAESGVESDDQPAGGRSTDDQPSSVATGKG